MKTRTQAVPVKRPSAFSYLRFSNPSQGEGDSVRRQTELRDAWLAKSGAVLDTSLSLTDKGVSGFTGAHRVNADRHALAAFLEHVKSGRVPRGSFLIVESLDRLTREHIRPAITLLLNLIDAGISVVQLLPVETVYDEHVEPMQLMMAVMELSRGHSESRVKSERVGRAWAEKKRLAATEKRPVTKRLPAWIEEQGGKLVLIPKKADAVRQVFRLAIEGSGVGAITKTLNARKVPPIAEADYWARSYVMKLLSNRAVIGEYQPHKGHAGPNRKPDGKAIVGYFPAAVTDDEWHAAQAALAGRRNRGGRPGGTINVFSGLLRDARDGGAIHSVNKGQKAGGPVLVSYRASMGVEGSTYATFPRATFETAILSRLKEINPAEIVPGDNSSANIVASLRGQELDLERRIEQLQSELEQGGEIAPLVAVLRKAEAERVKVAEELSVARREAASPVSVALGECRNLAELVASDPSNDTRNRLRAALRRAVEGITCLFVDRGAVRLAAVQIVFTGTDVRRLYLIGHKRGSGNQSTSQPSRWGEWSGAITALPSLDLRNPNDVKALDAQLSRWPIEEIEKQLTNVTV